MDTEVFLYTIHPIMTVQEQNKQLLFSDESKINNSQHTPYQDIRKRSPHVALSNLICNYPVFWLSHFFL